MVGITIGSNLDGLPLSDRSLEPLWARLNALRLPVFEHPMVPTFAAAMNDAASGQTAGRVALVIG